MNWKTVLRLALAETRKSQGKLLFCVFSIAVGVGSLTAVRTAILSLEHSIASQARNLMGADLMIRSSRGFQEEALVDMDRELQAAGARQANLIEFYSMMYRAGARPAARPANPVNADAGQAEARIPAQTRSTRLVRIRAVSNNYPMYGQIESEPAGVWPVLSAGDEPVLLADPQLLSTLELKAGDRVFLGDQGFRLGGEFLKTEGSPASGFGFAPAVYIHEKWLERTGLIQPGSRVRYMRLYRAPESFDVEGWKNDNFDRAAEASLTIQSFREGAASIQRFMSRLSHFLTVAGLITLLLGGLGIGSAMAVFIKAKLDHAAILRSLGARPGQVFFIYFALAMILGLVGSLVGVIPGSILPVLLGQAAASELAGDFLPVALDIRFSWLACAQGMAAGIIATFLFTLFPVYAARRVSPLRILRKSESEDEASGPLPEGWRGTLMRITRVLFPGLTLRDLPVYFGGMVLIFVFILLVTVTQTNSIRMALYFTGAVAGSLIMLSLVSRLVTIATRRLIPYISSYHIRQGVANLYRPGNQTASVITAIGVGMLLVASIYIMESSVQAQISVENREELPNIFLVDIQPAQLEGVKRLLAEEDVGDLMIAPLVSSRVRALNGEPIDRSGLERNAVERTWQDRMRTREYFLTYRDHVIDSEEVVRGEFWEGQPAEMEVSVEEGWANEMDVSLGDVVTLDVQGLEMNARITSVRRVQWQAMRPNSILVLSPGIIEQAPPMYVASFRVKDQERIFPFQEKLVRSFPNLSIIDVTEAVDNVRSILERISLVVRFLAAITLLNGIIILGGAIAAGRFARLRESMLLKVLGANRRDLRKILLSEYGILALLGCLAGWGLAEIINRPALTIFFQSTVVVPYGAILLILLGIVLLNVIVGFLISRDVAESRPLAVLRDE